MIRDRGRIKWTSMMLPEHVKLLRDWTKEDAHQQRKAVDEQQLERMNQTIAEAMEFSRPVMITHYRHRRYEQVGGKIHHWDEPGQKLHVVDRFGEVHYLPLESIVDVRPGE